MRPRLRVMLQKAEALEQQRQLQPKPTPEQLADHLQRLIMLHELTHIHHMDHSPAFHAELDALLDGKEKELERELKVFQKNSLKVQMP